MIQFLTDGCEMPVIDPCSTERWLRQVAAIHGFSLGDLTYIFCNDERILEVNRQFLGHDYYTDVITFDYSTPTRVSGDIYISLDTVRSNAEMVGVTYEDELHRILVHGVLHLTGQGDKTPETKIEMTRKEDAALALLNEQKV
ncbi:MAG: rRNA maturation RNase YbeY [Paludibacteraceae bacterium]|nr:rRNA maturation RNase YbeY [Paludibacteraceae bacterium]